MPRMEVALAALLLQASVLYSPLGYFLTIYSYDEAPEGCWKVSSRLGISRHYYCLGLVKKALNVYNHVTVFDFE